LKRKRRGWNRQIKGEKGDIRVKGKKGRRDKCVITLKESRERRRDIWKEGARKGGVEGEE
jgi:hypothetical protein